MTYSLVVDPESGKKTHVLLPIEEYERMLEELDDIEDLKAIKELEDEPVVSLDEVLADLEKRKESD